MTKKPPLRSFQTENFKAIRNSGRVEFGWLTVFIGNNGAGKSSLIEAMETFRDVVLEGVDPAFRRWRGFEHVWNKASPHSLRERLGLRAGFTSPMKFRFDWHHLQKHLIGQQSITQGPGGNTLFIQQEQLVQRRKDRTEKWTRTADGLVLFVGNRPSDVSPSVAGLSGMLDGKRAEMEKTRDRAATQSRAE